MKTLFGILLFTLFFFSSFTNEDAPFIFKKALPIKASHFTIDKFGNIYTANDKILQKFDSAFKLLYTYSDLNTGKLQLIDASNPLKLLLFYPEFASVSILDSRLSLQVEIDLRSINILQPTAICYSYNENIWVFDMQDFQLRRIDKRLKINNESGNLTQILGYSPHPDFMLEANNWLYVNNPESGILVFDIYGNYYKTIPIKDLHAFQIYNDQIFYTQEKHIGIYNLKKLFDREIQVPPNNDGFNSAFIDKNFLYILKEDSIKIYSY